MSPNTDKLQELLKLYKKQTNYFTGGGAYDFDKLLQDFITEESVPNFVCEEDDDVANGSSIAFIMELDDKKFLFLGDSHPSVIIEGLKMFGYNNKNLLQVELMKVSHHGSKCNTSKELLEIVKTNNYLISSNAARHGLPNKRTLARIIDNNPNAVIHFNYDLKDTILSGQDWVSFPNLRAKMTNEFTYE